VKDNGRQKAKDFVGDVLRESANGVIDGAFVDGYDEAANICVGVLSKNIDDLLNRIKSGSYLSDQEQFLLSKLNELKSETQSELRDFFANTGNE
jgi:hypothetical protein